MAIDLDSLNVVNNTEEKRFEIKLGHDLAFVEYLLAGKNIVFTHTEVPPAFEGQGVGNKLAKYVLDYAVEHDYQIQPLCPFIKAYIKRHPDAYKDRVWNM